ncbi:MAG: hypothetical protein DRP93_08075 [Candidatus Neomarinimicrobiota bacterium]|nr:MAG: hypothetical protein DRP93_08075 [Candidatus Neomarinimicrobiota bacterium]
MNIQTLEKNVSLPGVNVTKMANPITIGKPKPEIYVIYNIEESLFLHILKSMAMTAQTNY